MGDIIVAELFDLFFCQINSLFRNNPSRQHFTVTLIWNANDLYVAYFWMTIQIVFNLNRINILAAADDHIFTTTDDFDIAILVHRRQIASMHPAVLYRLASLKAATPIAFHH